MYLTLIKEYIPLIVMGFNVAIFVVIKFNDMKHFEEAMKRMESKLDKLDEDICDTGERVAALEGKCKANHG